jgi:hypothetical protein
MPNIKIAVKENNIALVGNVKLITGTVGATCQFYFNEEWALLEKKVAFKVGQTVVGVYDLKGTTLKIPSTVFRTAGLPLEIGVTGYNESKTIVTPTNWCVIGIIENGA